MPLRDHFRPPLTLRRHWHAFHNSWATYISADINRQLPGGYFAEAKVQFRQDRESVEIVVRKEEEALPSGVVRLVTPGNKEPFMKRAVLVSKCAGYLHEGTGLTLVDVVTTSEENLHRELVERLHSPNRTPPVGPLYAASYRPLTQDPSPGLAIWQESLELDRPLPTLPLWLRGGLCVAVRLEETYERTWEEQRVGVNGA